MLRVVFAASSLPHGGAERHTISIMNRLAERGHECHAVSVKAAAGPLDGLRLGSRGTLTRLDAARYLDWRAVRDFAALMTSVGPEVVVAANPYAHMYASLAARLSRAHPRLAVTFHTTLLQSLKEEIQMLWYRPFFWAADCLVFVSERQRQHWFKRGVLARRNDVIHNGVDTHEFRDRQGCAERARLRKAIGLTPGDFVIGLSGLLRPEKNHLQLVDAVALLRARGIPARALMIGDGEMRGAVEERARELGISSKITITGLQSDVRPYVGVCDAMTLCSVTETFSLAAIEAMAMRKPFVHSDVGGAAEMIVPGENGFLFPVGDTRAYADRLAVLADPAVARRMGDAARALVERRFSEAAMVDRYELLLLELCAGPRAVPALTH